MKQPRYIFCAAAAMLIATAGSPAQSKNSAQQADSQEGRGLAIVTVVPSHPKEQSPHVTAQDVQMLKVNGKPSQVLGFQHLNGAQNPAEIVILIDNGARSSLGTQMSDIKKFVQEMPPHTKMALAYMQNGAAMLGSPLSSDPAVVLKGLHVPAGPPQASASPYFCLSDLAKHWPSNDRAARREVIMISDGVDYYEMRYDPEDPYVHAAIDDSVRSDIVVYFLYWKNANWIDRFPWAQNTGQNLMNEVTQATGGYSYWQGLGNPVSFQPYFQNIRERLNDQYGLSFTAPLGDSTAFERMQLKLQAPNAKVDAPQEVFVHAASRAMR